MAIEMVMMKVILWANYTLKAAINVAIRTSDILKIQNWISKKV
jgi:CRISPR/Cas system CMR-associated protein Cmr5 small subunit